MQFHLNYNPPKFEFEITHSHRLLLTGSCFSENIGALLHKNKFEVVTNPSGILFNPVSVLNCLTRAISNKEPEGQQLVERDQVVYSFQHHSSINAPSAPLLQTKIKTIDHETGEYLKKTDYLILSFGTAYIYNHLKSNTVVANCHKQPGNNFKKELLSVEYIFTSYSAFIKNLLSFNPNIKILFTVSPVKYLRDGLHENNLSKSTLLLTVDKLVSEFRNCFYFPAFELVNDDLRDYRFYNEDLAHPTQQAIVYVWQKFAGAAFSEKTKQVLLLLDNLHKAQEHRPINNSQDPELQKFIDLQKAVILKLEPSFRF